MTEAQRILLVIEKLADLMNPDETDKTWNDIYRLAHSHAGHCDNPHNDWKAELPIFEKELKDI